MQSSFKRVSDSGVTALKTSACAAESFGRRNLLPQALSTGSCCWPQRSKYFSVLKHSTGEVSENRIVARCWYWNQEFVQYRRGKQVRKKLVQSGLELVLKCNVLILPR